MKPRHLLVLGALFPVGCAAAAEVTFNAHIRPILSANCFACHGPDEQHREAGLRLDQAESALGERKGVRAVVPRDLENSELWWRIKSPHEDEVMPPPKSNKPPLKPGDLALIKTWIEQGAVYQNHWAFEPIARPEPPRAISGAADHPVDRFVGARLAPLGLAFAPAASREILLRRITLDLTGLPPTLPEIDAFLADHAPGAYERVLDRLLASPRYGEHFARFWLDAVRYGDTHGLHLDNVRTIWPYRDWVVQAFNRNLPFDRFTIEQLAGDLLPAPRQEQLLATGYIRCNLSTSEGGAIATEVDARNTADRIETTAAVWLGLTAGCAACHDHKFDPLSQREYYSLGAFFKGLADPIFDANTQLPGPTLVLAENAAQERRLAEIAATLPVLTAALSARADAVTAALTDESSSPPKPAVAPTAAATVAAKAKAPAGKKKPVTYEVIWAEDGDVPTVTNFAAPPPPGEWRGGEGVPLTGGKRALRLEGTVERPFTFATGEVPLLVRTEAKAFVHLFPDSVRPPRAVSLEFVADSETRRFVWGDPAAFDPEVARTAIVAGPMPTPGAYARLELDACDGGVSEGKAYTALRIAQSDGAAWWDRAGMHCTSPSADDDPLLSRTAWLRAIKGKDRYLTNVPLTLEAKYLTSLGSGLQSAEEKLQLERYFRDLFYAPLRGALEPEVHAVRRLLAEQIHYETTRPVSLIARELVEPRPAHILIRGQYDKPGDLVSPGTPAFLPPLHAAGPRPTRLEFARWLVAPENPLTPRVTVNRFWQQLFGAGLVRTPADFGAQGDPPTHPALLDWLAAEFQRTGWDVKRLVRLLVTSRTYRQDSRVGPALLERDPENKLLARGPRHRLDAEVLRDQVLALSGLLEGEIGGPPVRPYQPPNIWEPVAYGGSNTRAYEQDSGAALYRRSLYTFWKRTAPPPAMATFDAPAREAFCVVRGRSNTPLQALALMNDVQHFEAARALAERLLRDTRTDADRLAVAFRTATARLPDPAERELLAHTLDAHRAHFARNVEAAAQVIHNGESMPSSTLPVGEFAAWTMVASLLLNLDEALTRN